MIFDEPRALALLQEASAPAGIDPAGAALLALGQNAVFELPAEGLVAKVGRTPGEAGTARAERELALAAWLDGAGVPVVRPAGGGVRVVREHPVTWWHRLAPAVRPARPADLAPLLTALHALPRAPVPLGRRDLLAPVDSWLAAAEGHVDPADAEFLRARKESFVTAIAELAPALPPGPIHGDALPRNVHVTPDGPVLLDLEYMAADFREHDLVVLALSQDRYGVPAEEVAAFNSAYGWDVREWPGFAVLRGARETASAAWVAQQAAGNPAAGAEFRRRVDSLRDGATAVRWFAF
ncbi:Ser/Thr protein kinase RdoA (MazF antagonist) [Kitasatospora sp. SolWspMP-SS2h]|uniref:phosphotransferase enzyme family protein n=1 Tax=Kitasatospora sp. SolWspMP-SS2h TaxID=1305729 RepID=UPI000DBAC743|nr:Ser/Thr protein kinase RdoA (MazF antagonist) [Kitasatospora sp. SolWspMP-SS2h]